MYQALIDTLVSACTSGPGQVSARRVQSGVWNENADDSDPAQTRMNELLASLSEEHRGVLAEVIAAEFSSGMFTAIEVLETARIVPFDEGISGTASDNFLDRLDDWQWPTSAE